MSAYNKFGWATVFLLIVTELLIVDCLWCDRSPVGVTAPKTPGDNGYKIVITGEPEKYIPGAVYTIRVQAPGDQYTVDKFSRFILVAEPADGHVAETYAGSFQLIPDSLVRFSENCPRTVKHTSELAKTEVHVRWTAPPVSAGCVIFRATVVKSVSQWFMDDGMLTNQFCPEDEDGQDEIDNLSPCCACDEAKYEMTFEGLWSALTHPKDFPQDTLSAHFSDVIGASHSPNYRFWEYDGEPSEGLKVLAEAGESKDLESELKENSDKIRTIIKARGLKNPNFYGHKTFSVFRADREHNLVSIVSKIVPSPDWFVGISGVNLCLPNCTWTGDKTINLYPWDAGTNDGISYSILGEPVIPKDRIRRIVWNSDENSPFYDSAGNMVKPFARLRLIMQRSYERSCDADLFRTDSYANDNGGDSDAQLMYDESEHQNKPECQVSLWSDWTSCPVTCGRGTQKRTRYYINNAKATSFGCNRRLLDKKNCYNSAGCRGTLYSQYGRNTLRSQSPTTDKFQDETGNNYCGTTEWFPWSQCSATCGRGRRTRERRYLQPLSAHTCTLQLQEHEICYGAIHDCSEIKIEPGCETTNWSEWGPCTVSCGKGVRVRTRFFVDNRASHRHCNLEMMEYETCTGVRPDCSAPEDTKEICKLPKQSGMCPNNGNHTRWYFDQGSLSCQRFIYYSCKGNKNNFRSEKECESQCGSLRNEMPYQNRRGGSNPSTDCMVTEWSDWTRCRRTCGMRTRSIISTSQNGGKPCPSLVKTKDCDEETLACRFEMQAASPEVRRSGQAYGRDYLYGSP